MRLVIPQAFMISPAAMKKGIAKRVNESTPTNIRVTKVFSGSCPWYRSPARAAMPSANATGMLIASKTTKAPKITLSIDQPLPCAPCRKPSASRPRTRSAMTAIPSGMAR